MTPFGHKMVHIKTINLTQKYSKIFCELLKPFLLRIPDNFYGNLEIRKLEAKNTLSE